jgi:hypothetical protein
MTNPATPQAASTGFVGTVAAVVMNVPAPPISEYGDGSDSASNSGGYGNSQSSGILQGKVAPVFNAGQPGGAAYAGLADVANSQIEQGGTVTKVASDASGNSVHFNNPAPAQSPARQAATDQTHAVLQPVFKNPA